MNLTESEKFWTVAVTIVIASVLWMTIGFYPTVIIWLGLQLWAISR